MSSIFLSILSIPELKISYIAIEKSCFIQSIPEYTKITKMVILLSKTQFMLKVYLSIPDSIPELFFKKRRV